MIHSKDIDSIVRLSPEALFEILLGVVCGLKEMDYECYYEILRLRKNIKVSTLKKRGIAKLIKDVFESGHAYDFIKILEEHELLEIIFPGINALLTVDGGHYHNELVYTHVVGALRALDKNKKIPWFVKLAALYHDCGKYTWEISSEGKRRFFNHAQKGEVIVERDLKRLGLDDEVILHVKTLVRMHMQQLDKGHSMRKLQRVFTEANLDPKYFFWVRYADNKGSAVYRTNFMFYWNLYKQFKQATQVKYEPSVRDLRIDGHILMKHFKRPGGKWLGQVLNYLFVGVQERGYVNETEDLLVKADEFMDWYGKGTK